MHFSSFYLNLSKMKKVEDKNSYCGRIKTEEETTSPPVTPVQCQLRAILKYPWGTNPDDAPYYGYVSEYLEVRKFSVHFLLFNCCRLVSNKLISHSTLSIIFSQAKLEMIGGSAVDTTELTYLIGAHILTLVQVSPFG